MRFVILILSGLMTATTFATIAVMAA